MADMFIAIIPYATDRFSLTSLITSVSVSKNLLKQIANVPNISVKIDFNAFMVFSVGCVYQAKAHEYHALIALN